MITIGINKKTIQSEAVVALNNEFTTTTGFELIGDTLTFNPEWHAIINNTEYSNTEQVVFTIPLTEAGKQRIDIIVFDTNSTFVRIAGEETDGSPAAPTIPHNTLLATFFNVTDSLISEPSELELQGLMIEKLFSWVMQLSIDVSEVRTIVNGLNLQQVRIIVAESGTINASDIINGFSQNGKSVVISNGAYAMNYVVNTSDSFVNTIIKDGTAAITFIQWPTRTLVPMDGTTVLNGVAGSKALISSIGDKDYLYITNY